MSFLPLARHRHLADDGPMDTDRRRPRWLDRAPEPLDVFHLAATTGLPLVAPAGPSRATRTPGPRPGTPTARREV